MQDFQKLLQWAEVIKTEYNKKDKLFQEKLDTAFAVEYTHNSTAIEGNTLTLMETKLFLKINYPCRARNCGKFMKQSTMNRHTDICKNLLPKMFLYRQMW